MYYLGRVSNGSLYVFVLIRRHIQTTVQLGCLSVVGQTSICLLLCSNVHRLY